MTPGAWLALSLASPLEEIAAIRGGNKVIDYLAARNIYPTMGEATLGDVATGDGMGPMPGAVEAGTADVEKALSVGGQANPLVGALVFLALLVATMWVMARFGRDGEFSNIKASAYNALTISWVAILGIPIFKFIFTRFPLPGVSSWVHSV